MKKNCILILLFLSWFNYKSQTNQFENLKKLIKETNQNAIIDDKLIMVSIWAPSNKESRALNKEIQRVQNIYKEAKLIGGKKGMYFFNYCISDNILNFKIAAQLDSLDINSSYLQMSNNLDFINSFGNKVPTTILFDSNGNIIDLNTSKENIFKLILNQITR